MKIILFFCFAGLAFGFQPMLKYKYHYEGVTETGIPEINTEGAAAGIKLDAVFEVTEDGHAVVKFENVKVGEYHGCLGCDRKHSISEEHFNTIKDVQLKEMIEKPFVANLYGKEEYSMMVETEEILWLRNIKRAIVGLFRNYMLRLNFELSESPLTKNIHKTEVIPKVFLNVEETIMGKCEVEYTVHKLDGFVGKELNERVENDGMVVDVQRDHLKVSEYETSKMTKKYSPKHIRLGQVPQLEEDLFHVTRVVNFNKCEHNVFLKHSSVGFQFDAGTPTYDWIGSRSSMTEYLFRGKAGALRMEVALTEGAVTIKALGIAEENLNTRSNQTLKLISVEECTTQTNITPSVTIKGWMQEVLTPHQVPKVSPKVPWVTYTGEETMVDGLEMITGIKQTKEEISAKKTYLMQSLKMAAKGLAAVKVSDEVAPEVIMKNLKDVKLVLETLPKETIEQILEEVIVPDNKKPNEIYEQKLLIDALVASGSKRAMHFILNMIKNKKISDFQGFLISATTMQTLQDVTVIPDIADFVLEISMRLEPFVASTVLINFATMINQYCVKPMAHINNYPGAMLGDEGCNLDYIKEKFTPRLISMIEDETKTWERIVAIKVIQKLGISQTVNILGPVALAQKGSSDQVRTAAIYALSKCNLPWELRDHAMQILSEIYTNVGEIPRLRVAALVVYSSWGPEASFFHKLARLSWREPSMAVAAFYKHIIQAFAVPTHPMYIKQHQAATHAIKFVRQVSPSMQHPYIFQDYKAVLTRQMEYMQKVGMFSYPYPEPFINFDLFSTMHHTINGMQMTMSEMFMSGGGIGEFIKNTFAKYANNDGHSKIVEDLYNKIQNVIHADPTSHREPMLTMQFKIFENVQFLFPITKETITSSQFTDSKYLASLLMELQSGLSQSIGKFFTVDSFKEFVPNEMGLPVYTSGGGNIILADQFNTRLSMSTSSKTNIPKKVHLHLEEYLKVITEVYGDMKVIVPWSNSKLSTSVTTTRGMSRPVITTIDVDASSNVNQPRITLTVEPAHDSKLSVVKAKTVPMTMIDALTLTGQTKNPSVKIPLKHENLNKIVHLPKTYTGLDYTVKWESQFRYPFDLYGFKQIINNLNKFETDTVLTHLLSSYTAQYWALELEFDPQHSETKKVTMEFKLQLADLNMHNEDISHMIHKVGDFDYGHDEFMHYKEDEFMHYAQSKHHTGHDQFQSEDLSEVENHGDVNMHDNFQQKSEKMTEHYGGKASSMDMTLGFMGRNTRKYELFYSWSKPVFSNLRKKVKSQLTLMRSPIPGVDNKDLSVCIDTQKITPLMSGFDKMETVMKRNLDVAITHTLTPYCKGKPMIVMDTTMKMTPVMMEKLHHEIPKDCDFDQFDPLHTFYSTVYDDVHVNLKWESECSMNRLPLLTNTINVLDDMFLKGFNGFMCEAKKSTHKLDLSLHRCPKTDLWFVKVERDDTTHKVDALPTNDFLDFFLSFRTVSAEKIEQLKGYNTLSDKCVIQHDKVRTFDGVVYKYEPTQCWTVVAKDCKEDKFLVLVRASTTKTNKKEVKIIDRENSLVINYIEGEKPDQGGVTEHYSKKTGELVVKVFHHEDKYIVFLPKRVKVTITDQVEVNILTKEVCGICGTKNFDKIMEFEGPKHCLYVKPQHFVTSWTAGGEKCNMNELMKKRTEVEEYQKTCHTAYDIFTKKPTYKQMHTEYQYKIKEIENKYCVTFLPYPKCHKGFFSLHTKTHQVSYNCWHKSNAPSVLSSSLQRGLDHLMNAVYSYPTSTEMSTVHFDVSCVETVN